MQPLTIACYVFQRMPGGMTIVEDSAPSLFMLVLLYDPCLERNTTCNELTEQSRVRKVSQGIYMRFKLSEQLGIEYDTILYHFCPSLRTLTRRQCQQGSGISQYQARLIKSADQVLAPRMVNACLTSNGRIHLGQQGRRH